MKPSEHLELENLALVAEMGRQLAHDSGNFVYNVLLQIEIFGRKLESGGHGWDGVKREAEALSSRLKEWQSFRAVEEGDIQDLDLNRIVSAAVEQLQHGDRVPCEPFVAREPLWFRSRAGAVKRLCCLLLASVRTAESTPLVVTTKKGDDTVVVCVSNIDPAPVNLHWLEDPDAARPNLLAATCRALAMRLDASFSAHSDSAGRISVAVEFPV